jgi:hypothetical protein
METFIYEPKRLPEGGMLAAINKFKHNRVRWNSKLDQLVKAYHKLYETWWMKVATLESDNFKYNLISHEDTNDLDKAAEEIEELLTEGDNESETS